MACPQHFDFNALSLYMYMYTIFYSTTVIAKIEGMPRSLFYVIPRYVTMDHEK